jgi:hypothetical protein
MRLSSTISGFLLAKKLEVSKDTIEKYDNYLRIVTKWDINPDVSEMTPQLTRQLVAWRL